MSSGNRQTGVEKLIVMKSVEGWGEERGEEKLILLIKIILLFEGSVRGAVKPWWVVRESNSNSQRGVHGHWDIKLDSWEGVASSKGYL